MFRVKFKRRKYALADLFPILEIANTPLSNVTRPHIRTGYATHMYKALSKSPEFPDVSQLMPLVAVFTTKRLRHRVVSFCIFFFPIMKSLGDPHYNVAQN